MLIERNDNLCVRTYTYTLVDSKMYVISKENAALVIDPCESDVAIECLKDHCVTEITILITHEHYDHISGIGMFRDVFTNCTVICTEACNKNMQSPIRNGSKHFAALLIDKSEELLKQAQQIPSVSYFADITFQQKFHFTWCGHDIKMILTPGHSVGSCCIIIDRVLLFTGDSLLKDHDVITRLPGGNKRAYFDITLPFLQGLCPEMIVFPGHGESGTLKEFLYRRGFYL